MVLAGGDGLLQPNAIARRVHRQPVHLRPLFFSVQGESQDASPFKRKPTIESTTRTLKAHVCNPFCLVNLR